MQEAMNNEGREEPTKEELEYLESLQVVFQPIKPYLYGFENIEGSTLKVPVQHKYAEIVLIPELLPKDSPLRKMAFKMEKNNIDVVLATSAVKVGAYGQVKSIDELDNAVIHKLSYDDYRIQTNVPEHVHQSRLFGTQFRKLLMSNLRRDDYSSYLGGKLVSIIKGEGKVNLTKRNLIRFYNSLVVANILDSFEEFKKRTNNSYKLSASAVYQLINNDRNLKDDIEAMSVDDFGDFILPLFEGSIEHDAAAMLFSIYKKLVNKQKILGGSAVQASDFGITGVDGKSNLQYITDEKNENILYAECEIPFNFSYVDSSGNEVKLKFADYCNSDGTFIKVGDKNKIEIDFPGILDIIAYRIPTERAYSMMNLKVVRCSHPILGGTIKVPSQGTTVAGFDYDIDKLYFMRKEFRQKVNTGFSEKAKNEIWAQVYENHPDILSALEYAKQAAGYSLEDPKSPSLNSFWDSTTLSYTYNKTEVFNEAVESLGITRDIRKEYWEEYDTEKTPFEQSASVRNNMILELSRQRLMDVETFEERYTPGGFRNPSKAARTMRELLFSNVKRFISGKSLKFNEVVESIDFEDYKSDPEPNYDPNNIETIITYNQLNQVAGKLIGIMANQNAHHNFISTFSECKLVKAIKFGSHAEFGLSDLLQSPKGNDAFLSIAELLASSVDAVKDPVLNYLNLNTITADAGALLARLGYSFEDIGLLFNQPAIVRLCEYCFDNNFNDISSAITIIAEELGVKKLSKEIENPALLSQDNMAYNIAASKSGLEADTKVQIQALLTFKRIHEAASELSQFILNSKFTAANSVSSTFGAAYEKQQRAREFAGLIIRGGLKHLKVKTNDYNDPIIEIKPDDVDLGSYAYLKRLLRNPMAYEQCMLDCNLEVLKEFNRYTPYESFGYKSARNRLTSFTINEFLDEETINSIHRELPAYILQNDEQSLLHPLAPSSKDKSISNKEYYLKVFPKQAVTRINNDPYLKGLTLFKYLIPSLKDGKYSLSPQSIGGTTSTQVDIIRGEITKLYRQEEYKDLIEDLFKYSFFTTGFNFNHNSLINLFPTEFKTSFVVRKDNVTGQSLTYAQYMKDIITTYHFQINDLDFAKKYCLNHTDNRKLVYYPKGKIANYIKALASPEGQNTYSDSFTVRYASLPRYASKLIIGGSQEQGNLVWRPYINIDGIIYEANSEGEVFNVGMAMQYIKVDALGDGVNSLNYGTSKSSNEDIDNAIDKKSVFDELLSTDIQSLPEEEVDRLYEAIVDDALAKNKIAGLESGLYASEEIADNVISAVREEYINISKEEKIQNLLDTAKELIKNTVDDEGNPPC
jgi:hypothetical protein